MAGKLLIDDELEETAETFRVAKAGAAENPVQFRSSRSSWNRGVRGDSKISGGPAGSLFRA